MFSAVSIRRSDRLRVAIICDYLEECWHSMDLVGELLINGLRRQEAGLVDAIQIRPEFRRYATRRSFLRANWSARNFDRLLNSHWLYPRYVKHLKPEFDIFHIIDHSYGHLVTSVFGSKAVVTCHDLDTFRCILQPNVDARSRLFRAVQRRKLKGLQCASGVICDSRWVRDQIVSFGLVPLNRLFVAPLAVPPEFSIDLDPTADRSMNELLGSSTADPFLLHVGSVAPRKRIDIVLKTFAGVKRLMPNMRLVRVGGRLTPPQKDLVKSLSIANSLVELPTLSRKELAALYRRAELVLLPSDREGYGLPIIEALACGTPVLVSDLPVLREVGEDAAEYAPVGEIDGWIDRALSLLEAKQSEASGWKQRQQRGIELTSHLNYISYGQQILRLYKSVLS
jgi:glycosyltransferase involved in cell wall biosynthesis